jgi:hypothetical protein
MTMKKISKKQTGVKVAAAIKAGGFPGTNNHSARLSSLSVKSGIRAGEGIFYPNHSRRAA